MSKWFLYDYYYGCCRRLQYYRHGGCCYDVVLCLDGGFLPDLFHCDCGWDRDDVRNRDDGGGDDDDDDDVYNRGHTIRDSGGDTKGRTNRNRGCPNTKDHTNRSMDLSNPNPISKTNLYRSRATMYNSNTKDWSM